jgi:cell division septum initiation protein DivIVA
MATNDNADDSSDSDDEQSYYGIGAERRRTLDTIEEKGRLDTVENPETIDDLTEAVAEICLDRVFGEPTSVVDQIESVHADLPSDEARAAYVDDDTLLRRINAARNQFNTWLNRRKRKAEMPSWVEAGPAKYPSDKFERRLQSERKASTELKERLKKVKSAANGARQRALNAVGSSVSEENAKRRAETREERRDAYEKGDLLQFRNPQLRVGTIHRVNQKSVRIEYPNPRRGGTKPLSDEPEPERLKTTVDLDSDYLKIVPVESFVAGEYDNERIQSQRDDLSDVGLLPDEGAPGR